MKRFLILSSAVALLTACAEKRLNEFEHKVTGSLTISPTTSLADQAIYSAKLSRAYVEAAQQSSKDQDVAAIVTYVAALSVVGGALASVSNDAIAAAAGLGTTTTLVANRTLSQDTIKGIYTSAKRMNCVATNANMGRYLLADASANTKAAARAATFGTIAEIQIITREALVRAVADYETVRDALTTAISKDRAKEVAAQNVGRGVEVQDFDLGALNQYLGLLDNCLAAAANVTAAKPIDKKK